MTVMPAVTLRLTGLFAGGGAIRREVRGVPAADSARFGRGLVAALLASVAAWLGIALALVG